MVDFPFVVIEFFFVILRLSRCKWKSVELGVFQRGGSIWAQISEGRGHRPPTTVRVRKLEWLPFRVVSKYPQCIEWFCHKARVWQTDRHTDELNVFVGGQDPEKSHRAYVKWLRAKAKQHRVERRLRKAELEDFNEGVVVHQPEDCKRAYKRSELGLQINCS